MPHPILETLRRRLDAEGLLTAEDEIQRFVEEPRRRWTARPVAVARPRNTAEVAWIVERCREQRLPLVTRGGGSGTVGGASASIERGELLLGLDRMRAVRAIDPAAAILTAEAGLTLDAARSTAHTHDLEVPLWLASGGSATLGGIAATNAGGNTTIRHGNARRMVLGVEAVLADGQVLDLLSGLRKDNTGYDLVGLLVGSEGTLGIITAVTLALVPRPAQRATAWCALDSPAAAIRLLARCRKHLGETLSAFELIPRFALQLVLTQRPDLREPLDQPAPWQVLLEADSAIAGEWLEDAVIAQLAEAEQAGEIGGAILARSGAQVDALWALRESISPAQARAGASIKRDIAVPVATIPQMIELTLAELEARVSGIRPCVFGHIGDGNLHFNLSRPLAMADEEFRALEPAINRLVFDRVEALGGSISAEHGIGQLRVAELAARGDPVKLELLYRIKQALDPDGLLNPGKLIELRGRVAAE